MGLSLIISKIKLTLGVFESKHSNSSFLKSNFLFIFNDMDLMNFRKLLNKETSFVVVSGGGATPLELDKVKWSKKIKDYWPKKNYKKIPYMN